MMWGYGHIGIFGQILIVVLYVLYSCWPFLVVAVLALLIYLVVRIRATASKVGTETPDEELL